MLCPKCGEELQLLGVKEIAGILNWDTRQVSVYRKRGKLPSPDFVLGMGPIWLFCTIKDFIEKHKKENPD